MIHKTEIARNFLFRAFLFLGQYFIEKERVETYNEFLKFVPLQAVIRKIWQKLISLTTGHDCLVMNDG